MLNDLKFIWEKRNFSEDKIEQLLARIFIVNHSSKAIEDAHAVAVLTEWDEFISINCEEQYARMKSCLCF